MRTGLIFMVVFGFLAQFSLVNIQSTESLSETILACDGCGGK